MAASDLRLFSRFVDFQWFAGGKIFAPRGGDDSIRRLRDVVNDGIMVTRPPGGKKG
jgi:hypothetical protein